MSTIKNIDIRKFVFIKNFSKKENLLYVWSLKKNKKEKIKIKKDCNYIIGYLHNNNKDGEFIKIKNKNNVTKIENDIYASHHLYKYSDKTEKFVVYSNSIDEIFKIKETEKILNIKKTYEYFAYGYLPSTSKTIYNNITLVKGSTKVKINSQINEVRKDYNIFEKKDLKTTASKLKLRLIGAIKQKIKDSSSSTFCMTGGLDTLLGSYFIKDIRRNLSLATWGTKNTNDIKRAKIRKRIFFKNSKHFILNVEEKKIPVNDIKQYAYDVGGYGNLSAINIMLFTKHLSKKKYHYYCDHYEATRRIFENIDSLISKYETPKNVIKKNFVNFLKYKKIVSYVHKRVKENYPVNNCKNFYFYDRYIKGTAMKNQIVNMNGSIKISLPIETKFLNSISNFIDLNNTKPYEKLFDIKNKNILNELKITKELSETQAHKPMPFNQFYLLKNYKKFFINEISKIEKTDLKKIFNLSRIKKTIKHQSFVINEQWFLLRFLSLIIFFNKFKSFKLV